MSTTREKPRTKRNQLKSNGYCSKGFPCEGGITAVREGLRSWERVLRLPRAKKKCQSTPCGAQTDSCQPEDRSFLRRFLTRLLSCVLCFLMCRRWFSVHSGDDGDDRDDGGDGRNYVPSTPTPPAPTPSPVTPPTPSPVPAPTPSPVTPARCDHCCPSCANFGNVSLTVLCFSV